MVSCARLGEVISARGLATHKDVAAAAARQSGIPSVDLEVEPNDLTLLNPSDKDAYLTHQILPWRKVGARTVYLISEPSHPQWLSLRLFLLVLLLPTTLEYTGCHILQQTHCQRPP